MNQKTIRPQAKTPIPPMPDGQHLLLRQLAIGGKCVYNFSLTIGYSGGRLRDMVNTNTWRAYLANAQCLLIAMVPVEEPANPLDIARWTESYELAEAKDGMTGSGWPDSIRQNGLPIGAYGIFEVKGGENIYNLSLAGMEAGKTVKAQIAVYG